MFEQNAPHFFYGERVSLTGVPGADDEFRFHPVEMGAGVGNDTIIAQFGIAISLDRDNRMTDHPGCQRGVCQRLQDRIVR